MVCSLIKEYKVKTTNNLLPTLSIFILTALIFATMSITTASFAKEKASKDFRQSYPGKGIEMTEIEATNGAIRACQGMMVVR